METLSKSRILRRSSRKSSRHSATLFGSTDSITEKSRSLSLLKILLFYGLSQQFDKNRKRIIIKRDKQHRERMLQNLQHTNKSIMIIEPIRKQTIELNKIKQIFDIIEQESKKLIIKKEKINQSDIQNQKSQKISNFFAGKQQSTNTTDFTKQTIALADISKVNFGETNDTMNSLHKQKIKILKKKQHFRAASDILQQISPPKKNRKSHQCSNTEEKPQQSLLINNSTSKNFYNNRCRQKIGYLKDISSGFNFNDYSVNSIRYIFQTFLQNIHKSNYMLNIFCNDYKPINQKKITSTNHNIQLKPILLKLVNKLPINYRYNISAYTNELQQKFTEMTQILENLIKKQRPSVPAKIPGSFSFEKNRYDTINCFEVNSSPLFGCYIDSSNKIIEKVRALLTSAYFSKTVSYHPKAIKQLINLVYDTRFTLKYLEKQIQNINYAKKTERFIPKWQKVFCAKFVPKKMIR